METTATERTYDVVIAGAGYVGLATAVAIRQAAPEMSVLLVDAAPEGVWRKDARASALAAAAVRTWQSIDAAHARALAEWLRCGRPDADPRPATPAYLPS